MAMCEALSRKHAYGRLHADLGQLLVLYKIRHYDAEKGAFHGLKASQGYEYQLVNVWLMHATRVLCSKRFKLEQLPLCGWENGSWSGTNLFLDGTGREGRHETREESQGKAQAAQRKAKTKNWRTIQKISKQSSTQKKPYLLRSICNELLSFFLHMIL